MARDYINFKRIENLTRISTEQTIPTYQKVLKLQEETGELAQAFLAYEGARNVSKSATATEGAVLEECCDVINTAMSIIEDLGVSSEEVRAMFDRKLDKWEAKLTK